MLDKLKNLSKQESFGGLLLMASAIFALIVANSPLSGIYDSVLHKNLNITFDGFGIDKPLLLWINDGLMAIFFLLVGMEVKAEIFEGSLSSRQKATLPFVAALGGMIVPALMYLFFNTGEATANGWAIPMATDIAFALGVMALLGKRVPIELKVFLLALAIIDDLGAIVVIALFYSHDMSLSAILVSGLMLIALFTLNRLKVSSMTLYLIAGTILWVAVLKSGIHATLAGVLIGFAIPLKDKLGNSPLHDYAHKMSPYVSFAILPIFAFANAGISLGQVSMTSLLEPVSLGIIFGLVLGKPIGVFSFVWLATKMKIATLPERINFKHIFGVSLLCGIGFTMSIFLSGLSFTDSHEINLTRLSILIGSLLSALLGYFYLKAVCVKPMQKEPVSAKIDYLPETNTNTVNENQESISTENEQTKTGV